MKIQYMFLMLLSLASIGRTEEPETKLRDTSRNITHAEMVELLENPVFAIPTYGPTVTVYKVELVGGNLEVIFRNTARIYYSDGRHEPDQIWKDVYVSTNGAVVMSHTVHAKSVKWSALGYDIEWPE